MTTTPTTKFLSFSVELKHPLTSSPVDAVYLLAGEVESRVNPESRSLRQIEDNAHAIEVLRRDVQ
jgi:hypothetical protein